MYIIVAGGGKVGRYLTEALLRRGHEMLLVERNEAKVRTYTEQFGEVVMQGDACEAAVLEDAGARRADVVIAVTGDDEDNLVICQMAKRKFGVPRTIARVNNPRNRRIMQQLGIDDVVSQTEVLLDIIEEKIPGEAALLHTLPLQNPAYSVLSVMINPNSPIANVLMSSIDFPENANVLVIMRGGAIVVPDDTARFEIGDEVIILTHTSAEAAVRELVQA